MYKRTCNNMQKVDGRRIPQISTYLTSLRLGRWKLHSHKAQVIYVMLTLRWVTSKVHDVNVINMVTHEVPISILRLP